MFPSSEEIHHGSGNVFAGLGFSDAEERQTQLRLAYALNQLIEKEGLNQTEIGERLGPPQPKVSVLANYKLHGFSVERLLQLFVAIDWDVVIHLGKKPKSGRAQIMVEAEAV